MQDRSDPGCNGKSPRRIVSAIQGKRILIVEDEFLIAATACEMLQELGAHVVGPASTIGAALALAPVCAYLAIAGTLAWPPIIMAGAVLLWTAGFDIIYACQVAEFDQQAGLHSLPSRLGIAPALAISRASGGSRSGWRLVSRASCGARKQKGKCKDICASCGRNRSE